MVRTKGELYFILGNISCLNFATKQAAAVDRRNDIDKAHCTISGTRWTRNSANARTDGSRPRREGINKLMDELATVALANYDARVRFPALNSARAARTSFVCGKEPIVVVGKRGSPSTFCASRRT